MNALAYALLVVVGILVAVVAGQYARGYLLLRRLRFGPGGFEDLPRRELPADARLVLDRAAATLVPLGFTYVGSRRILSQQRTGDPEPSYGDRYYHPETRSHALVQPAEAPERDAPFAVSFATPYPDGRTLLTANRRQHLFLPLPLAYRVEDGYLPDVAAQWQLHRERVSAEAPEPVEDVWEMERRDREATEGALGFWQQQGVMRPLADGQWQLTSAGAWGLLRRMAAGNRKVAKLPRSTSEVDESAIVAADLRAYRTSETLVSQGALSRRGKLILFAVSALAGTIAFGLWLGWELVPVLVGVLLFHEFGHALAMRLTGYRNLQVLMVPFLGAVASGRKDDAGPWTRLTVLLAGPAPGLILAVPCFYAAGLDGTPNVLLIEIGVTALVLNLFNLLPFPPLDGGQIVETFLFSRWPRLRSVFFLFSAMALATLGWWIDSHVLLALGLLLLLGVKGLWRHMKLAARIGTVERDAAPHAILATLHQTPGLTKLGFHARQGMLRALLPIVAARAPRAWESIAGLAIYLAVIALPLAALPPTVPLGSFVDALISKDDYAEAEEMPDWDAELESAPTADKRWQILTDAGIWLEDREYETGAYQRYQQALQVASSFPEDDLRTLDTQIALARTGPWEDMNQRYLELLPRLRNLVGPERIRLAEALEAMAWTDESASTADQTSRLREAIAVRESLDGPAFMVVSDRQAIARLLYLDGDPRGAETELVRNLELDAGTGQVESLAWLLIDTDRAAEAEALIDSHLPQPHPRQTAILKIVGAWAKFGQGRRDEAIRTLRSLLEATSPDHTFDRTDLLLDLMRLDSDPAARARWAEQAREALERWPSGSMVARARICSERQYQPWARWRATERLSALADLGLGDEPCDW